MPYSCPSHCATLCDTVHNPQTQHGCRGGSHSGGGGHRQPLVLCQVVSEVGEQDPPGQAPEEALDEDEQVGGDLQQGGRLLHRDALTVHKGRVCCKLCLQP